MKALVYKKSIPRFLLINGLGRFFPGLALSPFGVVRLEEILEPRLPGPDWVGVRPLLSGICGSDLSTVFAKGSPYFSPFTSCPFVLGHEVVGEVVETGESVTRVKTGDRVVLEPALGCRVRGIQPECPACTEGNYAACENVTRGVIAEGIQTGYCRDTGGAWSSRFVAHESQLFRVPSGLDDDLAVLCEPFSCALHAALKVEPDPDDLLLVIGCGTMGLLLIAALRFLGVKNRILASAWLPHQIEMARKLGADEVLTARGKDLYQEVADKTGSEIYQPEIGKPFLVSGPEIVIDCVGSSTSIQDSLRLARSGGRVILVGMPGIPSGVDWTAIWHKELQVLGTYAYGYEDHQGTKTRTFEIALELLKEKGESLRPLIGERYPLAQYREAIRVAALLRPSRSIKTLFDLRR